MFVCILCCAFVLFFFVLCTLCCQFLCVFLRPVYPMLSVSLCFSSSCVPYVASFSGLSYFGCPFSILWCLFTFDEMIMIMIKIYVIFVELCMKWHPFAHLKGIYLLLKWVTTYNFRIKSEMGKWPKERKKTKWQTIFYKTLHRKIKIEQHKPH